MLSFLYQLYGINQANLALWQHRLLPLKVCVCVCVLTGSTCIYTCSVSFRTLCKPGGQEIFKGGIPPALAPLNGTLMCSSKCACYWLPSARIKFGSVCFFPQEILVYCKRCEQWILLHGRRLNDKPTATRLRSVAMQKPVLDKGINCKYFRHLAVCKAVFHTNRIIRK